MFWKVILSAIARKKFAWTRIYKGADKSLARPGRKQANVSVRMAWISFGALPCKKKKTLWHFTSRCCWSRARRWHTSELVSFLVGLRTYQHPVNTKSLPRKNCLNNKTNSVRIFFLGGGGWMKSKVSKIRLYTPGELFARILGAAVRTKKCQDQLWRKVHDLRTRFA